MLYQDDAMVSRLLYLPLKVFGTKIQNKSGRKYIAATE